MQQLVTMESVLLKANEEATVRGQQEHNLGKAGNIEGILAALGSRSQQKSTGAVELMAGMGQQQLETAFFEGENRTRTLHSLGHCMGTLPWDGKHCRMLLEIILDLKLEEEELIKASIYRKVFSMCSQAPKATAALAQRIVFGLQQKDRASLPLIPNLEPARMDPEKKRKNSTPDLKKVAVCLYCKEVCKETICCSGCMRSVHLKCCTLAGLTPAYPYDPDEALICCVDCQTIAAASEELVAATAEQGFIRLSSLSKDFPANLVITTTAGAKPLTDAQAEVILPAAIELLSMFKTDTRPVRSHGEVKLVETFVRRQHPLWCFNNTLTLTVWAVPLSQLDNIQLKDCVPVATIVYRIQGKELVDLLYAATDKDVRGCKLLQVAMLALQLQLQPMGVERVYLDAAGETAKSVWCAIGFSVIPEAQHKILAYQYTLVLNDLWCISARCIKLVPSKASLLSQVCTLAPKVPKDIVALKKARQNKPTTTYSQGNDHEPQQPPQHQAEPAAQDHQLVQSKPSRKRFATARALASGVNLPSYFSGVSNAPTVRQ